MGGRGVLKLPERYVDLLRVGRGMSGAVYRGTDRELGRPVAIKVFSNLHVEPEAVERLQREARSLAAHPHEAVVPLLDAALTADPPFLVLAWMEGGSLLSRLTHYQALEPRWALRMGVRLAGALAHLHGRGLLHRDVKAANVLLDGADEAYLADFGLILPGDAAPLTRTGFVVGTPRYMAPELLRGEDYTPTSDLYALAVVLLESLVGYAGDPRLRAEGPRLELVGAVQPPALRRVLERCLARQPSARFPSARILGERLEEVLVGAPGEPLGFASEGIPEQIPGSETVTEVRMQGSASAPDRSPHREGLARRRALGIAVGLAALLGALLWLGAPGAAPPPPPDPVAAGGTGTTTEDALAVALERVEEGFSRMPDREVVRAVQRVQVGRDGIGALLDAAAPLLDPRVPHRWTACMGRLRAWLDAVEASRLRRVRRIGPALDPKWIRYAGEFLRAYWEFRREAMAQILLAGPRADDLGAAVAVWDTGAEVLRAATRPMRDRLLRRIEDRTLRELLLGVRLAAVEPPPEALPALLEIARRLPGEDDPELRSLGRSCLEMLLGELRTQHLGTCEEVLTLAGALLRVLREAPDRLHPRDPAITELMAVTSREIEACQPAQYARFVALGREFLSWYETRSDSRGIRRARLLALAGLRKRMGPLPPEVEAYRQELLRLVEAGAGAP